MGYTPDEALINVDFTGTRLDGLHVKIHDMETDEYLDLLRLFDAAKDGERTGIRDADTLDKLFTQVAELIVEWDLEIPKGSPLPATRAVIGRRSIARFTLPLVDMCIGAVSDVGDELGKGSGSTPPSPAGLPMTAV